MTIIGFIGAQRSGKTLSMANMMKSYHDKGFIIITNMKHLGFPVIQLTPSMMESDMEIKKLKEKLKGCRICIGMDEAHLWLDSRRAGKNAGKSWLITQAGKLMEEQGHFFWCSQFFNQVDLRLRYNTSFLIRVEKHPEGDPPYFRWLIHKDAGERIVFSHHVDIAAASLYKDGLYDRFEMIDIPDDSKKR